MAGKIRKNVQKATKVVPFVIETLRIISKNISASQDSFMIPVITKNAQVVAPLGSDMRRE